MPFKELILSAPHETGVYKMLDSSGVLLYVGKAKDLFKRLRQYVDPERLEYHKVLMRRHVAKVEWVICVSEAEALILEQQIIKAERPKYNIILKDDKMYPFLALSDGDFPRLYKFRGTITSTATNTFGPFPFISDLADTIKLVQKICQVRTCSDSVMNSRRRPCLLSQLGLCAAPCTLAGQAGYRPRVKMARGILSGRIKAVVTDLTREMKAASKVMDFETAARICRKIEALQSTCDSAKKVAKIDGQRGKKK